MNPSLYQAQRNPMGPSAPEFVFRPIEGFAAVSRNNDLITSGSGAVNYSMQPPRFVEGRFVFQNDPFTSVPELRQCPSFRTDQAQSNDGAFAFPAAAANRPYVREVIPLHYLA